LSSANALNRMASSICLQVPHFPWFQEKSGNGVIVDSDNRCWEVDVT
jgi:hypothetical protein